MTFIINCRDNDRQFDWVNNLPHAWKLSESEFGGYLAQFQNRYPDYADRLKALNLWPFDLTSKKVRLTKK